MFLSVYFQCVSVYFSVCVLLCYCVLVCDCVLERLCFSVCDLVSVFSVFALVCFSVCVF